MSGRAMPIPLLRVGMAFALAGGAMAVQAQSTRPGNPLDQLPAPAAVPAPRDPAPRVELRAPAGPGAGRLDADTGHEAGVDAEGRLGGGVADRAAYPLAGSLGAVGRLLAGRPGRTGGCRRPVVGHVPGQ